MWLSNPVVIKPAGVPRGKGYPAHEPTSFRGASRSWYAISTPEHSRPWAGADLTSTDADDHALGIAGRGMTGGVDFRVVGPDVGSLLCPFASHFESDSTVEMSSMVNGL